MLRIVEQLHTTHISGPDFALVDDAEGGAGNAVRKMIQTRMIEQGQNMSYISPILMSLTQGGGASWWH